MQILTVNGFQTWKHQPKKETKTSVLFLHGSGERGSNPDRVLDWGLPKAVCLHHEAADFRLYAPQCPADTLWSDHIAALREVVGRLRCSHPEDSIVLAGFSLGGEGVLELAASMELELTRVIAVAPRYSAKLQELGIRRLARQNVLLAHGNADPVVPIENSEQIAKALGVAGGRVAFEVLEGRDHYVADSFFSIEEFRRRLR